MSKEYLKALAADAQAELEDVLLDKKVWIALIGVVVALSVWQGWDIPYPVFVAIEALIVAVILALSEK